MTVGDELLWESQPAEIQRIAEVFITSRVEAATDSVFREGMSHGHSQGYNSGYEAGVAEGLRRARSQKDVA